VETDVPLGPPIETTLEPEEEVDVNELVFAPGAWCCPLENVPPSVTSVTHIPRPEPLTAMDYYPPVPKLVKDALDDDELAGMLVLLTRRDDNSSDGEDDDEAEIEHFMKTDTRK
jgi:hypothetical protein